MICTTAPNVYLVSAADGTQSCHARYVDNSDGTVTDNQTGLMWEKKTAAVGTANTADVHDVNNLYTWSAASSTDPTGMLYSDFLQQLNGLDFSVGASCFAGHFDWRIPSIGKLRTIVPSSYPACSHRCTPPDPPFGPTQLQFDWSSSSLAGNVSNALYVSFFNGTVNLNGKQNDGYARAFRSGR